MRLRAVRSFVWTGRDVDVGDEFEAANAQEAHILVNGYQYCVPADGEEAPIPPSAMTVAHRDPAPRRRRGSE